VTELTYPEVGATRTALPPGYHHLRYRTRVGAGRRVFDTAGLAVVEWRMHEGMHVHPRASAPRAEPGVRVTLTLGGRLAGIDAPCEVVWSVVEPRRIGFAYGTLAGHPECGEEAFLVEQDDDGAVWFAVTAFSKPAAWYARAAGPLVPPLQHAYARACGFVLRRIARQG
jgi:uncharacterized protein (UPF0548 family)